MSPVALLKRAAKGTCHWKIPYKSTTPTRLHCYQNGAQCSYNALYCLNKRIGDECQCDWDVDTSAKQHPQQKEPRRRPRPPYQRRGQSQNTKELLQRRDGQEPGLITERTVLESADASSVPFARRAPKPPKTPQQHELPSVKDLFEPGQKQARKDTSTKRKQPTREQAEEEGPSTKKDKSAGSDKQTVPISKDNKPQGLCKSTGSTAALRCLYNGFDCSRERCLVMGARCPCQWNPIFQPESPHNIKKHEISENLPTGVCKNVHGRTPFYCYLHKFKCADETCPKYGKACQCTRNKPVPSDTTGRIK